MKTQYNENGFVVIRDFLSNKDRVELVSVLSEFHRLWQVNNARFYAEKAINSAYLTGKEYLNNNQRQVLFDFIASTKLMNMVTKLIPLQPCFMNTQLFFDPVNKQQKNYWHRDTQYHLSLEQQQAALIGPEVIHFRFALFDEPGIEVIPKTHKRWDNSEELNVRLGQNNRQNYQTLPQGKVIKLKAGDLLIFSANIIHRGLYGMDRLALDILFCQPEPSIIEFVNEDCLPAEETLKNLENPSAFRNTIELKSAMNKL